MGLRDMGEIVAAEVGNGELAENVVEDRGRVFDGVVAVNESGRLEPGEGEGLDIFFERNAVLQAERHRDREIVHERPERGALLVHVNEDFTQPAVGVLAGPEIDLVASDPRLLGIAAAPRRSAGASCAAVMSRSIFMDLWSFHGFDVLRAGESGPAGRVEC
jgi:hypothetical protein